MPGQRSSATIRGFRVTLRRGVAGIPGVDIIALRAFLRAVVALQTAVEDLWAAVRQRGLQKRAVERCGTNDAPQETQRAGKLLRSSAREAMFDMHSISSFWPRLPPRPFSLAWNCCYRSLRIDRARLLVAAGARQPSKKLAQVVIGDERAAS
jgi:hypothetical protein